MDVVSAVREAGVIGAGGAGFPTYVKLNAKADYILLNGAECEPLLRVDQQLLGLFSTDILEGFYAAGKHIGAEKALIGIKKKHAALIEKLRADIQDMGYGDYIRVVPLKDVYPAGDEQVLVYELTGRIVPEASIPIQVGCVVVNAETTLNISHALKGKPVTKTYLTLGGDIPHRMTLCVPVGTPVREVLALSGVSNLDDYAVIDGGPMMGSLMKNIDGAVTKRNKAFILLQKEHPLIRRKAVSFETARIVNKAACEQCRMCTDLCPRYLLGHSIEPHKIMRSYNYGLSGSTPQTVSQLCSGCNLCQMFSCPAGLYPKLMNDHNKAQLAVLKIKYQPTGVPPSVRAIREFRQIPSQRLIARLGLSDFDQPAPFRLEEWKSDRRTILTSQHIGAPAVPTVKVGDLVVSGQRIGEIPEGSIGAAIHASCNGEVVDVRQDAIVIEVRK
ncbi:putative ferredoxin [Oscillibacter valericigenes Sjm18-20]|nr:putative ferredoxin [Oscillibacter valericigenes Sjm18-20]